jgi:hypothetical protein
VNYWIWIIHGSYPGRRPFLNKWQIPVFTGNLYGIEMQLAMLLRFRKLIISIFIIIFIATSFHIYGTLSPRRELSLEMPESDNIDVIVDRLKSILLGVYFKNKTSGSSY